MVKLVYGIECPFDIWANISEESLESLEVSPFEFSPIGEFSRVYGKVVLTKPDEVWEFLKIDDDIAKLINDQIQNLDTEFSGMLEKFLKCWVESLSVITKENEESHKDDNLTVEERYKLIEHCQLPDRVQLNFYVIMN